MPVILYTYLPVRDDPKEASPLQGPWLSYHDSKITERVLRSLRFVCELECRASPWTLGIVNTDVGMLQFSCLGIPVFASLKRKLCLTQCELPAKAASSGVESIVNFHLPGTGVQDDCVVLVCLLLTECMQGCRDAGTEKVMGKIKRAYLLHPIT
jgi:hypothetical protein